LGLHSRPHWGSLQRSTDPYLDFRGPTSKGSEGMGKAKKGKEGEGTKRGREGNGGRPLPALPNSLRHWVRRALRGE